MKRAMPTILLEPNRLHQEGLRRILSGTNFRIVRAVASHEEFLADGPPMEVDLVLACVEAIDRATADLILSVRASFPATRLVILAESDAAADVNAAFAAGANAYLCRRDITAEMLIKSLELIMLKGSVVPATAFTPASPRRPAVIEPEIAAPPGAAAAPEEAADHLPHLSARETRILAALKCGDSNKLIARQLEISEATVKVHVKAVLRKIRARNRTQAAIWAMTHAVGDAGYPAHSNVTGTVRDSGVASLPTAS